MSVLHLEGVWEWKQEAAKRLRVWNGSMILP